MDIFGYYEWLEIREAIRKVRSIYKNLIEQELNSLFSRMSKVITVPPQLAPRRRSTTAEGPVLRNETSVKFTAEEILFKKWQVDLQMLNLRLLACRPMPSATIIMDHEHGIYFEDGQGELRFQRATEIPKARTHYLTNLLTIVLDDRNQVLPFMFNKIIQHELDERFRRGEEFIDLPPP